MDLIPRRCMVAIGVRLWCRNFRDASACLARSVRLPTQTSHHMTTLLPAHRSWTDQYLVYVYGTWLLWLLELLWCQLFLPLGTQPAQLRRQTLDLSAWTRPLLGWRQLQGGAEKPPVAKEAAEEAAEAAADAAETGRNNGKGTDEQEAQQLMLADSQLAPLRGLRQLNLGDALSGV